MLCVNLQAHLIRNIFRELLKALSGNCWNSNYCILCTECVDSYAAESTFSELLNSFNNSLKPKNHCLCCEKHCFLDAADQRMLSINNSDQPISPYLWVSMTFHAICGSWTLVTSSVLLERLQSLRNWFTWIEWICKFLKSKCFSEQGVLLVDQYGIGGQWQEQSTST